MTRVNKFPFELSVEATKENPKENVEIETPWIDEDRDFHDQFEHDLIYKDNDLVVSEFRYENGFHYVSIVKPGKSIIKSNWELDYVPSTKKYLPRIQ